jgi:L-rhamnose mutarotase
MRQYVPIGSGVMDFKPIGDAGAGPVFRGHEGNLPPLFEHDERVPCLRSFQTAADYGGDGMKRVAFVLKVREEKLQDYKMHHRVVWPEMLDALRRTGWRNYSLFLRKDGLLFGYLEAPTNFQTALADMAKEEVNTRWQEFMAPYFESLEGARPDEMMLELEEVFHLD